MFQAPDTSAGVAQHSAASLILLSKEQIVDHPQYLPLRLLKPVTLASGTACSGFFLPDRSSQPPLLLTRWGDTPYVVHLEGPHAFHYFQVTPNVQLTGLLVETAEFHVDLDSRYPSHEDAEAGALCLKGGEASLLGQPAGGHYLGLSEFPLWGNYPTGPSEVAARFARWKLLLADGDRILELWTHNRGAAAPMIL